MPEDFQAILDLVGKNANLGIADVIALLNGTPVSVPVQPANVSVAGKTLTVALQANAVQFQLH